MKLEETAMVGKPNELYLAEDREERAVRLAATGNFAEAVTLLKDAVEMRGKALGEADAGVAVPLDHLATVYCRLKQYAQAEDSYKQAQEILEKAYYPEHAAVGPVVEHLAECYIEQGKLEEAEPLLKKVLEIHQKTSRGERLDILSATRKLIHLYQKMGKYADAEAVLKKALTTSDTPWGPVEDFLFDQAVNCQEQGKDAEAETAYKKAISAYRQRCKIEGLIQSLRSYAGFLRKLDRKSEADQAEAAADLIGKGQG